MGEESGMPDIADAQEKERRLNAWLARARQVVVGYSGGVDSAFLASAAVDTLGTGSVLAVIGRSASYPAEQWQRARDVAAVIGLSVLELDTRELDDPRYAANPTNRCYYCKTELWSALRRVADERGIATIIDGTNADDLSDYRPGAQAARERGVRSPLAEVGLRKDEIRELARRRGVRVWDQPSAPCLSSRIPYGTPVTTVRLAQVERAEAALRAIGVRGDLRVRYHDDLARIELAPTELDTWLAPDRADAIARAVIGAGFARVSIDLHGFRSGSLNVLSGIVAA